MHPRNIYKDGHPNFEALSHKHPTLETYLIRDSKGKVRIDFKNKAALRTLTRVLLLEDFNLNVIFPEDSLVPTIPLRLNYILWIEDLLSLNSLGADVTPVRGIDVGTGASTVYALLGARKNGWSMTGTESNPESVRFAVKNVERNDLSALVQIHQVHDDTILRGVLEQAQAENRIFDFTMCNPPFFSSIEETDSCVKVKRKRRPEPSGAKTGIQTELVVIGGEEKFIQDMIAESKEFPRQVRIYTTMVGVKSHLKSTIEQLKSAQVKQYTTTEFIQGRTMRWGLAWTFDENIKLLPTPTKAKLKPSTAPLMFSFPCQLKPETLLAKMKEIILTLEAKILLEENLKLEILAERNTWSHQRRKRREQNRLSGNSKCNEVSPEKIPRSNRTNDGPQFQQNYSDSEMPQSSTNAGEHNKTNGVNESNTQISQDRPGLHFNLTVTCYSSCGTILLEYLGGSLGKEGLNQVLQFIKNVLQQPKT